MESVARISTLVDPARGLTLDAAQTIGTSKSSRQLPTVKTIPAQKLKALLDSRSDRDILDGLKRVVTMIYMNKPALPFFSSVVKNVANPNIEVKKLVYVYLLHYAESDPDLALLSVNAIQKSLSDQNPQVRALALKTMSGMKVPVISQIVFLAIKKGVADLSPHVRKAAGLAIPKCYRLDPNTLPQLLDCLTQLLGDKQYFVVGPAVQVFLEVCTERIDLLHKHYRNLVRKAVDMDEWSQLATLRVLLFYARKCFTKPEDITRSAATDANNTRDFYDDEPDSVEHNTKMATIDPDLEALLKMSQFLLTSRNSAVVLAAASNLIYLGTSTHQATAIGPLIALMRSSPEITSTVLPSIISLALHQPRLFLPYTTHFLLTSTDPLSTSLLKLEALTLIYPHSSSTQRNLILAELIYHTHSTTTTLSTESIRALGRCASSHPQSTSHIFHILLSQIQDLGDHQSTISEILTVIRHLIQQNPSAHRKTIIRLARNLDRTVSPEARATIIWLVGEFPDPETNIAPDVLRILLKDFANEPEQAKHQILLLGAKVYLNYLVEHFPPAQTPSDTNTEMAAETNQNDTIVKLWQYLLLLVRYDVSYDLRDRARLFKSLLQNPQSTQLASLLIQAPKPVPLNPSPSEYKRDILMTSTALLTDTPTYSSQASLPDWADPDDVPDPSVREEDVAEEYVSAHSGVETGTASTRLDRAVKEQGLEGVVKRVAGGKERSLDAWLNEDSEEEESSEEEEESTDEEEEETSEDESD